MVLPDSGIRKEIAFGVNLVKNILRSKNFLTAGEGDILHIVDLTLASCLNGFDPSYGLDFHDYFVGNIYYGVFEYLRQSAGRYPKHREAAEYEYVQHDEIINNEVYISIQTDDTLNRKYIFLYSVLNRLPKRCQYVLIRHFIIGDSIAEIARALGITRQGANQIKLRAIERARRIVHHGEHSKGRIPRNRGRCGDDARLHPGPPG